MSEAIPKGSPWLRAVLGEVVCCIAHTRDNYLAAQYRRLSRRRGAHKAVVAVAHSVLVVIYHMRRNQRPYTDLGADYFDRLDTARLERQHVRRLERQHVRRLEQLGYTVTLTPAVVA
jgi:transposase